MFGTVPTSPKRAEDYRPLIGDLAMDQLRQLAKPHAGVRVLHLSVTAFGTGVAEMLNAAVPLMDDLGLACEWQVIRTSEDFNTANKAIYNALGGLFVPWTVDMYDTWRSYNAMNAELMDQPYDYIIVHDPQPVGLLSSIEALGKRHLGKRWIWHCHLDLSEAQPEVWDVLRPSVERYDAVLFDMQDYVRSELRVPHIGVVQPTIDPLSTRNMIKVSDEMVKTVLHRFGVDPQRPMICQVSPFDVWHDPLDVIEVYRRAKEQVPGLQLVLVASMVPEDTQERSYYELTAERSKEDSDIHVLSTLNDVSNVEVNVFQRSAVAVIQRGLRKGFGLGVAEAMWKERPVVAGRVGGMPAQIIDGETGYVVDNDQEWVERIVYLLQNPGVADKMGRRAKEHVRQNYLITRQLKDYLSLFNTISEGCK